MKRRSLAPSLLAFLAPLMADDPAIDPGGGGGGAPGGGAGAAPADPGPWYGKDVDADTKAYIERNGFKDWGGVLKTAINQEKLIGVPAEQLLRLPADRSPEKLMSVLDQLGRPKEAAGYEVKPNAEIGLDGPALEGFLKVAHEKAGLLPWQLKPLLDWYAENAAEGAKLQETNSAKAIEDGDKAMRAMFGAAHDEKVARINELLKTHGDEDLDEYLFESGRGNDPRFAKFLDKIADLVAEQPGLPGEKGRDTERGGALTPGQAQEKLREFETANQAALMSKSHPDHKHLVAEREKLIAMAYPAAKAS
jgi:hypothetical protein